MIVALIGPPGSGKTQLGHLLASSLAFDFVETEKELLERYGSREEFLANKRAALAELERSLRDRAASSAVPVVVEGTGLSDGPMLNRLRAEFPCVFVKVFAPRELCVSRVRARERGRNLGNDPDEAARFHDFWLREVAPRYAFDLEVVNDGESEASIVRSLAEFITTAQR